MRVSVTLRHRCNQRSGALFGTARQKAAGDVEAKACLFVKQLRMAKAGAEGVEGHGWLVTLAHAGGEFAEVQDLDELGVGIAVGHVRFGHVVQGLEDVGVLLGREQTIIVDVGADECEARGDVELACCFLELGKDQQGE